VVGTCQEGECGLPVWAVPSLAPLSPLETKHDGDEVDIVCQALGPKLVTSYGGSSSVWDRLLDGGWVSDYFVNTPGRGGLSAPIPACPA